MAGFRKAKAEQAALKMGLYGASGRGKTLTALLIAEGLAKITGKRIAMVDTEHGSDFYCKHVGERKVHPEAFDFDALYTKSLTDTIAEVKKLKPDEYSVVIIDSMTHLWESARNAWSGKTTRAGTLPIYAWGPIKKPYKELMSYLLSSPMHFIICAREGKEVEEDDDTGEMKIIGTKMKAEGETPYEPHVCLHLFSERDKQTGDMVYKAIAEKDRSGKLAGRQIILWPSKSNTTAFDQLAAPLLPLLGNSQAKMASEDETSARDAEAISEEEKRRIEGSELHLSEFSAEMQLAKTMDALKAIGNRITPEIKAQMMPSDLTELKDRYREHEKRLSGGRRLEPIS